MNAASAKPSSVLTWAERPQRVLVIVTRRIGDVLLATPVVRSIKNSWPSAEIDMLVFAGTEGFVTANRDVNRVLTVAERPRLLEHLRFVLRLARRYDLALSLVPGDRPTLYAYIAGIRRAGLLLATGKHRWKRALLNAWMPFDDKNTHTVLMHLALLDAIGVPAVRDVVVAWTPEDERAAKTLLDPLGPAPYAVLHPYPKFRYKMWHERGWVEVAQWLRARGVKIVVTGGPEPEEREYVGRLAAQVPDALDLSGRLSLGALGYVLSRATVYVGPDTAITHAAAALGVPTVALYGPTNAVKWGPWPSGCTSVHNPWQRRGDQSCERVRLIQGRAGCVPCLKEGCDGHVASTSDCLVNLRAEIVIDAMSDLAPAAALRDAAAR